MGQVIVVDAWLLNLASKGPYQAKVANALMRAQVKTAGKSGHLLDLRSEYIRRQITSSANWGKVAHVMVPCMRCGWHAWLEDWVQASNYTLEEAAEALLKLRKAQGAQMTFFLTGCQGEPYWGATSDLMEITEPKED